MTLPDDIINLCFLFYYIPFYSANVTVGGSKVFTLKHTRFCARIETNPYMNTDIYMNYIYDLFSFEFPRKECLQFHSITFYHELMCDDQLIDIGIVTFEQDDNKSGYKVQFEADPQSKAFTFNVRILRVASFDQKYLDFNPGGNMYTMMRIEWNLDQIHTKNMVFSSKFSNNYWCMTAKRPMSDDVCGYLFLVIGIRLLCLPVGISKLTIKCALNSTKRVTKTLSYRCCHSSKKRIEERDSECMMRLFESSSAHMHEQARDLKIMMDVDILHAYNYSGKKIPRKYWARYGLIKPKMGRKHIELLKSYRGGNIKRDSY